MLKKLISVIAVLAIALPIALLPANVHASTSISITSPTNGSTLNATSFTVTGTATANRKITVKVNGSSVGTTTSDSSGNWSLNVTGQGAGAKTVEAVASGQLMYSNILNVGDFSASRMSRINTLTNTEESSFSIYANSAFPINWKPNPAFTKAYGVAPYLNLGTVWVMDLVSGSVTTFELPGSGQRGASIAYNEDGSRVYITDNANTTVYVYNTTTEAQVGSGILIGNAPHSNTKRPFHDEIWVNNSADGTISVISTASNTVIHTYNVGGGPDGMAFSPDGSKVYVNNSADIMVINANSGAVEDTITGTATGSALLINSDGSKLYSSHPITPSNTVDVFNLNNNTLEATITVNTGPFGMALTADDSKLYVANPNFVGSLSGTTISIVDTATNTVTQTITPGGGAPFLVIAAPPESASASISFTLAAADGLADTGDNTKALSYLALSLVIFGLAAAMTASRRHTI